MDFETRKQQLVDEFNKNNQVINQLSQKQQQIIGQLNFITEMEKESEPKEKEPKDEKKK